MKALRNLPTRRIKGFVRRLASHGHLAGVIPLPGGCGELPVRRLDMPLQGLGSEWDGATLVHLSDLHCGPTTLDVPTKWFVTSGTTSQAAWNRKPGQAGYGLCPTVAYSGAGETNQLQSLSGFDLPGDPDTANPNLYDTQVAWATAGIAANRGTGLQNVKMTELQHLYVTGRMPTGENLNTVTRDCGSGTRNFTMNSMGVDPSQGKGDNLGDKLLTDTKTTAGHTTYLGANHQYTNLDSTGMSASAVQHNRLGVAYIGADRVKTDANAGKYEALGVGKDLPGSGWDTVSYVRPTLVAILDNTNVNSGWQIGGAETFVTVGDPQATPIMQSGTTTPYLPGNGNPAMINAEAAKYLRNIQDSVANFVVTTTNPRHDGMPGQTLAYLFVLNSGVDALPSASDPTVFVANNTTNFPGTPGLVQAVQDYIAANNAAYNLNAYGSAPNCTAGYVPGRVKLSGTNTYTDGQAGDYYRYFTLSGTTLVQQTIQGNTKKLSQRNQLTGDFNNDHQRNLMDIPTLVSAVASPTTFEAGTNHGGNAGDMLGDYVIPEVLGDFNGDGNLDKKDVRYFADGLAISTTTGKLDRKAGFTLVDSSAGGNYFGVSLKRGSFKNGDSRGDIAGDPATYKNAPGAAPTAYDGTVDFWDVKYVCDQVGKFSNMTLGGDWSSLNDAVQFDLSADMTGDLKVNLSDVQEITRNILDLLPGDANVDNYVSDNDLSLLLANWHANKTWIHGDFNATGYVDDNDLSLLLANWTGAGHAAIPEPATLTLLAVGGLLALRRNRKG